MTSTEVAKKTKANGAVATYDYGEDAGAGFEGTRGLDLSIPFLGILQSNSPQVEDKDPEGASPGMLFNTVTRELIDGDRGVLFLPYHKEGPLWIEWVPRVKGGGFVGMHAPESDVVKNGEAIINPETGKPTRKLRHGENELIETFYVYGLVLDNDDCLDPIGFAVISFTSTKIKPHRDWMTSMYTLRVPGAGGRKVNPPIFANRARLKTVKQKNDAGTFHNFRISPLEDTWAAGVLNPADQSHLALLTEAKDFLEMVKSGMARAAFETERAAGDGGSVGASSSGSDDEHIPF